MSRSASTARATSSQSPGAKWWWAFCRRFSSGGRKRAVFDEQFAFANSIAGKLNSRVN